MPKKDAKLSLAKEEGGEELEEGGRKGGWAGVWAGLREGQGAGLYRTAEITNRAQDRFSPLISALAKNTCKDKSELSGGGGGGTSCLWVVAAAASPREKKK